MSPKSLCGALQAQEAVEEDRAVVVAQAEQLVAVVDPVAKAVAVAVHSSPGLFCSRLRQARQLPSPLGRAEQAARAVQVEQAVPVDQA
jgi:hypothetical protein